MSTFKQDWKSVYGDIFEEGEDGLPQPGQVIKYFRELRAWTTEELATIIGLNSRRTIERMENENQFLDSITRRRVLIAALGIPPYLLGLTDFKGLPPQQDIPIPTTLKNRPSFHVNELQASLTNYWKLHYAGNVINSLREIEQKIDLQQKFLHSAQGKDQTLRTYLLCCYYLLIVDIARYQRDYKAVFDYAHHAIQLAKSSQNPELIAAALMRRAVSFYERGKPGDFDAAKKDYDESLPYAERSCSMLKGIVYAHAGVVYAHMAQDRNDKQQAIRLVDQAGRLITSQKQANSSIDNFIPIDMEEPWYHNLRANTWIELREPDEAIHALDLFYDRSEADEPLLLAFNHFYRAKAETLQGHFPYAASLADHALELFSKVKLKHGIFRLEQLINELSLSPYGNSKEVAQLRVKLIDKKMRRWLVPDEED